MHGWSHLGIATLRTFYWSCFDARIYVRTVFEFALRARPLRRLVGSTNARGRTRAHEWDTETALGPPHPSRHGGIFRARQISYRKHTHTRRPDHDSHNSSWPRSAWQGRQIPDLYDLYDLYDLPHVAGWKPYSLHHLGHLSWVRSVFYRSCTATHTGRLGYRLSTSYQDHDLNQI